MRSSFRVLSLRPMSLLEPQVRRESLPVICVGNDAGLLHLREQVIDRATGLEVMSVRPLEAHRIIHSAVARVWVFCSTVEREDLLRLANEALTYSPKSKLLLLDGDQISSTEAALFHCVLDPLRNIEAMVAAIKQLAAGKMVSASDSN